MTVGEGEYEAEKEVCGFAEHLLHSDVWLPTKRDLMFLRDVGCETWPPEFRARLAPSASPDQARRFVNNATAVFTSLTLCGNYP